MISRRDVALRLDIPLEMARRHDLPKEMTEAQFAELDSNPPPWLVQSRANRRAGARPVWQDLVCVVCGASETVRPKKWWPEYTYMACYHHSPDEVPPPAPGSYRSEVDGVGTRFVAIVDVPGGR